MSTGRVWTLPANSYRLKAIRIPKIRESGSVGVQAGSECVEKHQRSENMIGLNRMVRELAPKPSDAIKALIVGLKELPSADFDVDMGTFGGIDLVDGRIVCFGCAATCAVHKLAGKAPSLEHIEYANRRARYLGFDASDMNAFELCINTFRQGWVDELLEDYYGLDCRMLPDELSRDQLWYLTTEDWQEQLPMIEEYVKKLEAAGF